MSMLHVHRAEKLGASTGGREKTLEAIRGTELSEVRSEAGCNMLFVFLLSRWGNLFQFGVGGLAEGLEQSEAFQTEVVDAYTSAGCSVDEQVEDESRTRRSLEDIRLLGGGRPAGDLVSVRVRRVGVWGELLDGVHAGTKAHELDSEAAFLIARYN